jgi:hypothetical protein
MSKKFTDLGQLTTPATDDILPIDDVSASTTKKITVSDLLRTSGGLTAQYMSNPYKFRAYRNAAWTTGAGVATKIIFDTENFDTGNNFDTTNGRFTPPVAGFYQFNARSDANTSAVLIILYKNGAEYARGSTRDTTTSPSGSQVSDLIQLVATDYVEAHFYTAGATAGGVGGSTTYFSGYLISAT